MKYFFLSDSWTAGRIWEFGGLWNEAAWQRSPHIQPQSLCIKEQGDTLRLYEAEEAVLMVEVMPKAITQPTIGQVVLKRLLTAEQVIERLCTEEHIFQGTIEEAEEVEENLDDDTDTQGNQPDRTTSSSQSSNSQSSNLQSSNSQHLKHNHNHSTGSRLRLTTLAQRGPGY